MSTPPTFSLFPTLPFDIRHIIWVLLIPHRIVDLDWLPWDEDLEPPTKCTGFRETGWKNNLPPLISRVCRESRAVWKELNHGHGIPGLIHGMTEDRWGRDHKGGFEIVGRYLNEWFNPRVDVVHMNWSKFLHIGLEIDCDLPHFLRISSQSLASISADLLPSAEFPVQSLPSYYFSPPIHPDSEETARLELLETRKDYLVVMKMITIHAPIDLTIQNGAFGRLDEEPYVLVKPSDHEFIQQFQDLWAEASPTDSEAQKSLDQALDTSPTTSISTLEREIEKWIFELKVFWIKYKCEQVTRKDSAHTWDLV